MAYDSALLDRIDEAIESLISGTRKVSLTMGNKQIVYGQTDLSDLQELRDRVAAEVLENEGTTRPKLFARITTSKGI